jgi:hypothetical protein
MPARQAGAEGSAGIAPADAVPQVIFPHDTCVKERCRWLHYGCTDASLTELPTCWPNLAPHIIQAIMALVRTSRGSGDRSPPTRAVRSVPASHAARGSWAWLYQRIARAPASGCILRHDFSFNQIVDVTAGRVLGAFGELRPLGGGEFAFEPVEQAVHDGVFCITPRKPSFQTGGADFSGGV